MEKLPPISVFFPHTQISRASNIQKNFAEKVPSPSGTSVGVNQHLYRTFQAGGGKAISSRATANYRKAPYSQASTSTEQNDSSSQVEDQEEKKFRKLVSGLIGNLMPKYSHKMSLNIYLMYNIMSIFMIKIYNKSN
eukprot:GHVP01016285.1.p1 GENE.GHVP01016285.1~~GHVP01016285.1.p1  ORF type:complete len:136 (+),score=16.39 GHVP01016285.1:571-978(+)